MTAVRQRDARVVIIDDTPDMRKVLTLMLNRYDGVVVVGEAGDGCAGIDVVRRERPDLVLLDLAMPRMDGLEALPRIKAVHPACEVVVLSGFEAQRMGMQALDAGATAYIQKGASPEELVAALASILGRDLVQRVRRRPRAGAIDTDLAAPDRAGVPAGVSGSGVGGGDGADAGRVIARVAHELRNPALALSFLAGELMSRRSESPERADKVVEAIARQAAVIDRITNDLMTSSHARRRSLNVRPRPFNLAVSLNEVVAFMPDARNVVEVLCPGDLGLFADRVRLQQVVTNLVSNAIKYGRPPVRVEARIAGSDVQIRVTDAGAGVPEWFVDRLFEEYSRADLHAGVGTGIGLFIVRAIAEAHGGRAWYEPGGTGASFVVSFPAAPNSAG